MAEQYRFFGSAEGDIREYSQVEFAEVFGTIIGNGYLGQVDNELEVTQNTPDNMNVLVQSGQAWINGYWYKNDSNKTITIANANGVNPRIDLVVLRLDTLNSRSIVATVITGTPASVPVVPSLTQTSQIWEIPLAQVYVSAGAISIVQANITDERYQALLQDTDEILAEVDVIASDLSDLETVVNNNTSLIYSSTQSHTLLSASWTGASAPYSYSLTVSGVTATSNQDVIPSLSITQSQLDALQKANVVDGGQSTNTIVLKAFGTKPAIDIPIRVILRGVK